MIKRIFLVLTVVALTVGAIYWSESVQTQKQSAGKRGRGEAVPVLAGQAKTGQFDVTLEGVGTARARNVVTVKPQVDGKILTINFKEGQDVKKGDLLAKIDPASFQAQLDQALAKKALDEAQLANTKRDLERFTKVGTLAVSQQQIDTQRALVAQQEAGVKGDAAAIENLQITLGYTDVLAPIDGRTGIRLVDAGNLVRSGDAGIVTITEVKPIAVLFTLPQQVLPKVNAALARGPVEAVALAADGTSALDTGRLEVVDNQVDQTTGTIRLKAEFPNINLQLWPGQFVNVRIRLETLQHVVSVPTPVVQRGPSGTFAYVIGSDDTVAMRPVSVSYQTETEAVISSGLADGEKVVTSGFGRLQQGAKVVIMSAGAGEGQGGRGAAPPADSQRTSDAVGNAGAVPALAAEAETTATATPNGEDTHGQHHQGQRRKREANGG